MVFYFLNAILKMRKTKINEMLIWRECWRLMLMTGQNHFPPRRMKRYSPIKKHGGDNSSISFRKRLVKLLRSFGKKTLRRSPSIKNTQVLGCSQDRSWGFGGVVKRNF